MLLRSPRGCVESVHRMPLYVWALPRQLRLPPQQGRPLKRAPCTPPKLYLPKQERLQGCKCVGFLQCCNLELRLSEQCPIPLSAVFYGFYPKRFLCLVQHTFRDTEQLRLLYKYLLRTPCICQHFTQQIFRLLRFLFSDGTVEKVIYSNVIMANPVKSGFLI